MKQNQFTLLINPQDTNMCNDTQAILASYEEKSLNDYKTLIAA